MSTAPSMRRADRQMPESEAMALLAAGFCGRIATVGPDGWPYCLPLLYVWMEGCVFLHNARAPGHLLRNIRHEPRACFSVDEPGEVFPYGRFECDSSLAYRSVIVFGRVALVEDTETRQRFCEALMGKYGKADWGRPQGFFPRLDAISVYALTPERITGKAAALPVAAERWPAVDRTKSPGAAVR